MHLSCANPSNKLHIFSTNGLEKKIVKMKALSVGAPSRVVPCLSVLCPHSPHVYSTVNLLLTYLASITESAHPSTLVWSSRADQAKIFNGHLPQTNCAGGRPGLEKHCTSECVHRLKRSMCLLNRVRLLQGTGVVVPQEYLGCKGVQRQRSRSDTHPGGPNDWYPRLIGKIKYPLE